jgi:hypothetical protein
MSRSLGALLTVCLLAPQAHAYKGDPINVESMKENPSVKDEAEKLSFSSANQVRAHLIFNYWLLSNLEKAKAISNLAGYETGDSTWKTSVQFISLYADIMAGAVGVKLLGVISKPLVVNGDIIAFEEKFVELSNEIYAYRNFIRKNLNGGTYSAEMRSSGIIIDTLHAIDAKQAELAALLETKAKTYAASGLFGKLARGTRIVFGAGLAALVVADGGQLVASFQVDPATYDKKIAELNQTIDQQNAILEQYNPPEDSRDHNGHFHF